MSFLLQKLTLSEWSDIPTDQNEDEPQFNTPFKAPDDDEGAVFFTVKESRNKQIKIRKLEISERGISVWDPESHTELEVFPFQKIKTFYYAPDGNFVVITISTKAGSENIPWKTNKQAQQVKIAIEDTIAKLLKKRRAKYFAIVTPNLLQKWNQKSHPRKWEKTMIFFIWKVNT